MSPEQVLELESTNVKALYRRAQAYTALVDLELAELDIKKALEIDPDNR
jgi:tetratricopeptide (TPR) repeat protein